MSFEFLEKIPEVLKFSLADVAKICIGAFLVGFMAWGWVRSIRKATRALIEAERHRAIAQIAEDKAEYHRQAAETKAQFLNEKVELQQDVLRAQQATQEVDAERDRAVAELVVLQKRLADLESFDGRLWEREHVTAPPGFVDLTRRKTRLIAIMNLKGGVGKTTLTANLGLTLARRGHCVLLVDLDFQGSLTRLCLGSEERNDLVRKRLTVSRLLQAEGDGPVLPVPDIAQRVSTALLPNITFEIIGASEDLAEAELRAQARWLVTSKPDARFLLRQAFHTPPVFLRYDFVLFDCPPRLTTACINSLGCSDFLLVPVLLEQGSVEALPRTLAWLTRLPHVSRAQPLGVVANRVEFWGEQPIASQRTVYNFLPEAIKRAGCGAVSLFRAVVRNKRNHIEAAANAGRIAAAEDEGLALFADVATEVEKGVNP
jgi:cellulose biosynthesis protein BcsQ